MRFFGLVFIFTYLDCTVFFSILLLVLNACFCAARFFFIHGETTDSFGLLCVYIFFLFGVVFVCVCVFISSYGVTSLSVLILRANYNKVERQ